MMIYNNDNNDNDNQITTNKWWVGGCIKDNK